MRVRKKLGEKSGIFVIFLTINHLAPPCYPVYKVLLVIGLAVHNLIAASMPLPSRIQRSSHNCVDESDIIPYVRKAGAF